MPNQAPSFGTLEKNSKLYELVKDMPKDAVEVHAKEVLPYWDKIPEYSPARERKFLIWRLCNQVLEGGVICVMREFTEQPDGIKKLGGRHVILKNQSRDTHDKIMTLIDERKVEKNCKEVAAEQEAAIAASQARLAELSAKNKPTEFTFVGDAYYKATVPDPPQEGKDVKIIKNDPSVSTITKTANTVLPIPSPGRRVSSSREAVYAARKARIEEFALEYTASKVGRDVLKKTRPNFVPK